MYKDRQEGGVRLATFLKTYHKAKETIVLGLPRGGVVVANEVAKSLDLPLDVICPRKIGAPGNPEYAIGATTAQGEPIFNEEALAQIRPSRAWLDQAARSEAEEADKRERRFREGKPTRDLEGKTVILIDDGLATGLTMKAALQQVKQEGAAKTVIAIPVAPFDTLEELRALADEVICPLTPAFFMAIGEFYEDFGQTSSEEVMQILRGKR